MTKNKRIRWLEVEDPYRSEPLPAEIDAIDRRVPRHPPPADAKRWDSSLALSIAERYRWVVHDYASREAYAGSYRRGKSDVGDMDFLFIPRPPYLDATYIFERIEIRREIAEIFSMGHERMSFLTREGLQIDLVSTTPESWGACLQYFTGSRDHNISLRALAKSRGLTLNEYGLWRGEQKLAGASEGDVYKALGLRWLPPRFREGPLRRK